MIKLLLKLIVVALVANAAWHLMTAYTAYYKFKDSVQQTTQFGNDKNVEQLKMRILALAADYDLPISEDDLSVRREGVHTIVDTSYSKSIDLAPGFSQPWRFEVHVDTFSEAPMAAPSR